MSIRPSLMLLSGLVALTVSSGAFAQTATTAPIPNHPRVNEVNQRIENQEKRIDAGAASGTITPQQAARDTARVDRIENRAAAVEEKNGGHLTKGQQVRFNHKLNKTSRAIHRQRQQ